MSSHSVIICTHNPRQDVLDRSLNSLRAQTLARDQWELIVIDNASDRDLSAELDLSWHTKARIVRENQMGLTAARLRGIAESVGEVIVFVDDDNVLASDYLHETCEIAKSWPILGTWGANIVPEFESPPPDWTKPYWRYLAIRSFETDIWSNSLLDGSAHPYGAGMCVRRSVAARYAAEVASSPLRKRLDRQGNNLLSGGDSDIVTTACRNGLGYGVFRSLKVTHLIPSKRLDEDYLVNMSENLGISYLLLNYAASNRIEIPPRNLRFYARHLFNCLLLSRRERRFYLAGLRSHRKALELLAQIPGTKLPAS